MDFIEALMKMEEGYIVQSGDQYFKMKDGVIVFSTDKVSWSKSHKSANNHLEEEYTLVPKARKKRYLYIYQYNGKFAITFDHYSSSKEAQKYVGNNLHKVLGPILESEIEVEI
jgi:hypothetical protein